MFKKILRKLLGMETKEFTFSKIGTGPNVAPPPQTPKPKVKASGQRGCFSPDSPLDVSNPPLRPGTTTHIIGDEVVGYFVNPNSSKCVGKNAFAYGQHKIFQDDPQPISTVDTKPKKEYFRDPSGKFAKNLQQRLDDNV